MSKRNKPKKVIITWPKTMEPRPTMTSSQGQPASPAHGSRCRRESDWYHRVSVCHLDCPARNISCQGTIVRLSPDLVSALPLRRSSSSCREAQPEASALTLALVAPHTFLYCDSQRELRDWKLRTGPDKVASLRLHERHVSHFFTCCGPHGVWGGTFPHRGSYIDENSCPFQADFIVFVLKPDLTDQFRDVFTIPSLPSLDETQFSHVLSRGNHFLSLIQREVSGVVKTHRVLPKSSPSPSSSLPGTNLSIEEGIAAYNESTRLQYTCGNTELCSGAAVVYFDSETPDNALVVAAMHLYSRRDDEIFIHCGISLPAIFHAIAGSRVCGVVPCLSLLVGACNRRHWSQRFYQELQNCLHSRNDPRDKQQRYRWISQLLTVCDYLCRDEARAILRLEVTDAPRVVLASLNLLSTLLDCFRREVEVEGLSRFHCQINGVFLRRASEQFFVSLERLFQKLYKHLVHSRTNNSVIIVCVECWLKMCTIAGPKCSAFYEVAKFTRVMRLRDSQRFHASAHFQRLFGDLCLAFLTHTRMTVHEVVGSEASRVRIGELERENESLRTELERMRKELVTHGKEESRGKACRGRPSYAGESCVHFECSCFQTPMSSVGRMDSESGFWEQDLNTVLTENRALREALGSVFHNLDCGGADDGVWTCFIRCVEERLGEDLTKPPESSLLSEADSSEGDRLQLLVGEWSSKEEVSLHLFCEVARELGCGERVRRVLEEMERQSGTVPSLDEGRNSTAQVI